MNLSVMPIESKRGHHFSSLTAGKSVYYEHVLPQGKSLGTVLLLHGLGDHVGRHEWAFRLLADSGYEVIAIDWPGSGMSAGIRGDLPRVKEVSPLIEEVLGHADRRPVGVMAHSTGGFFLMHLLRDPPAPLSNLEWCWFSSALLQPDHGQPAIKVAGARLLAALFPRFTLSTGVHPSDCYHVPPGEDPDHFTHGIHNRISLGFGADLLDTAKEADFIEAAEWYPEGIKTLLVVGGEDPVCPPEFALQYFSRLPRDSATLLYHAGARHEPFREPDASRSLGSIRVWLKNRVRESALAGCG